MDFGLPMASTGGQPRSKCNGTNVGVYTVYLVDATPGYSATAVGVNSCVRCLFAAITTVFSSAAVEGLGNGIMFTILAVIGILNGCFIIACYLKGTQWRRSFEQKHMPDLYILNNPNLADVSDLVGKSEKMDFSKQNQDQDLEIYTPSIAHVFLNHLYIYPIFQHLLTTIPHNYYIIILYI
ncbi:unnamed protein product [Mucor fragilis]